MILTALCIIAFLKSQSPNNQVIYLRCFQVNTARVNTFAAPLTILSEIWIGGIRLIVPKFANRHLYLKHSVKTTSTQNDLSNPHYAAISVLFNTSFGKRRQVHAYCQKSPFLYMSRYYQGHSTLTRYSRLEVNNVCIVEYR